VGATVRRPGVTHLEVPISGALRYERLGGRSMIQVDRPCPWKLRPTEVVPSSQASGDRKNHEDGAYILNREVEYDE